MKIRIVLVLAIASMLGLAACDGLADNSKLTEGWQDAPISNRDYSAADIGTMPDGFSNYASKCDGPNRVYVLFHNTSPYGSVAVVPNDERCTAK